MACSAWVWPTAITSDMEGYLFVPFILALQSVIYTYDGWSAVIYFSQEVKDYGRSIPRAMLSSVVTIAALYIFINLAFLAVVSLPTIAGNNFAAGVVAERLFGSNGSMVLRGLVILVLLSAVSSNVLMAPRVLFAMANDGLFWRGAREVNRGGTPDIALLISSLLAALFIVTGSRVREEALSTRKRICALLAMVSLGLSSCSAFMALRPIGVAASSPGVSSARWTR